MIKTKSIVHWLFSISVILYSNFAIFYKNAKIGKLIFWYIMLYLQKSQGPHERLLPLQNWTEKRFIFSNTGVHSGDKSGNRIFRNVWPFEKLRVENWQICLNITGRIFIILPRLMVILPALFDFSRPWRFFLAQKSYWTLHFCHTLMLLEEK